MIHYQHININECSSKWASKGHQGLAGHQVCVRSSSDQKDFSLPITFLTASHLAVLQKPSTGTTAVHRRRASVFEKKTKKNKTKASWQATRSDQQPPTKTKGGESSAAEQPVHRESVGRTEPLSLSHFLCMCLSHYFIFSLSAQSGQLNSDWNVVLATSGGHSQILCSFISRLSCVNAAVSVVFSHLLHFTNPAVCISTWASAAGFSTTMSVDDWYDVAVLWTERLVQADHILTAHLLPGMFYFIRWPNVELRLRSQLILWVRHQMTVVWRARSATGKVIGEESESFPCRHNQVSSPHDVSVELYPNSSWYVWYVIYIYTSMFWSHS